MKEMKELFSVMLLATVLVACGQSKLPKDVLQVNKQFGIKLNSNMKPVEKEEVFLDGYQVDHVFEVDGLVLNVAKIGEVKNRIDQLSKLEPVFSTSYSDGLSFGFIYEVSEGLYAYELVSRDSLNNEGISLRLVGSDLKRIKDSEKFRYLRKLVIRL